jgi:hypothetical protein
MDLLAELLMNRAATAESNCRERLAHDLKQLQGHHLDREKTLDHFDSVSASISEHLSQIRFLEACRDMNFSEQTLLDDSLPLTLSQPDMDAYSEAIDFVGSDLRNFYSRVISSSNSQAKRKL